MDLNPAGLASLEGEKIWTRIGPEGRPRAVTGENKAVPKPRRERPQEEPV